MFVTALDEGVGKVLTTLEETGMLNDTIVVFRYLLFQIIEELRFSVAKTRNCMFTGKIKNVERH